MNYSFSVAVAIFAICGTVVVYRLYLSSTAKIPGPFLARVSILWQLWHVWNCDFHEEVKRAHRKYGPFVRISYQEVSVCHHEAVRKILLCPLDKGSWYKIFAMPDSSFINQMSQLSAKRFAVLQKKIARGYSLSTILQSEHHMDQLIAAFKDAIEKIASKEAPVSLDEWFSYFSFDVVGIVTFSKAFGFLAHGKDIGGCVATSRKLATYLAIMAYFPALHDLLTAAMGPLLAWLDLQPMKHVMSTTEKAIAERETNDSVSSDMVAYWKAQKDGDPISDRDLLATANANIAAGSETVGSMMQAVLYHILNNQRCHRRLREEIHNAARQGFISSPVQYKASLKLPYFQACLKEAYRYHPIAPVGYVRVASIEGMKIGNTYFPPGTQLSVNPWAMHFNLDLFGADADIFRPERWLESDTSEITKHFIPFGAGYMTCPGKQLAHVEISKLLITMFLDYEMELDTPEKKWSLSSTVVLRPYGWQVRMKKRAI